MQKISQERINNIKKHLLDNLTISGVMEAIGESRGTVQRVNEMLKIPATGNKGGSPKALTERDQKYSEGQNWQDVCQLRELSLTFRR